MEFSYTESTDTGTNMVTKDYSKSRMRENRTYGSVRGGQSNLIPSTRLRRCRGFRGGGIAIEATAWQGSKGSEGSEGSKGKVSPWRAIST